MKRSFLSHAACCLVGIGIGVIAITLKPGGKTGTVDAENPRTTPATRKVRENPSQAAKQKQTAARQLLGSMPHRDNYSERRKWLEQLSISRIPVLLEALCENISPGGLDYHDKSAIEKSIERWLKESPDECVAWINQLQPGATKRYFLETLLEEMLKTDPERALAMSESYQSEDPDWKHEAITARYVRFKISDAWKKPDVTAEEMLTLFSELPRGNSSGGSNLESYPESFDFKAFLDGMASLNKEDGKQPRTMPLDLLEKWARRDLQAATQWFLQNAEDKASVPFQDWGDIATAVTATSGAAAYHQWAADLLAQASENQFNKIVEEIERRDALDIAFAIQDTSLRDRTLQKMASRAVGDDPSQAITLYAEISTPQARLTAIEQNSTYYFREWLKDNSLTAAHWQKLGLTEQQVRAAVEK